MIKEFIQQTSQLIEIIKKVDPATYQDHRHVLDDLVRT